MHQTENVTCKIVHDAKNAKLSMFTVCLKVLESSCCNKALVVWFAGLQEQEKVSMLSF